MPALEELFLGTNCFMRLNTVMLKGIPFFGPFFRRLARTGPDAPERPVSHRQHGKGVHQIQRPTLRLQQLRGVGEFHRCFLFTS